MKKQFWAIMLALVMVLSMASVAFAGEESAVAFIGDNGYPTLQDAVNNANAGDIIKIMAGTYAVPSINAGITLEGEVDENGDPAVLLEGTLSGTLDNLTLKNLHIRSGNAQRWAYAKGDLLFENVIFDATSVYALHFDGITEGTNLTYKNCTIIGWAAMGGSPASCVFDGCTIKGNGSYGLIRTYFDATIENCTFDVANVNTTDVYQDGIHAVNGATVIVNNCTNLNGDMMDILNKTGEGTEIILDGKAYPKGTITYGFTTDNRIWGEGTSNSTESFVVELYADEEKIASTSLQNYEGIIDGDVYVTWGIPFDGSDSNYWDVEWEPGHPNAKVQPTKVVLYADGIKVAENEVQMNGPDNLNPVEWEQLDALKVAEVNGVKYATLEEALNAAVNGDTITLLTDITEDVTVVQAPDVKITIDGGNNTFSGTITIDGKSAAYATAALTIQNVKFDATNIGENACINLGVSGNNNTRYTSNVTVNNCTFTDTDESAVGIKNYTGGCKNLTITNCTATGMHSLMQVKGVTGLTIDKVDINSARGISVGTSTNVSVTNSTIIATGSDKYGIRADGSGAFTMSIEDCDIKAAKPVVVRKTTGAYNLTIKGDETTMTATGTDGCVIITSGDDEETPVKPNDSVGYTAEITGGTYSDNETSEVADGYIVKKNSDTEYVVIVKEKLTSGTYMADPTGFTAAGYLVKENNDDTWTVYKKSSGGSSSGTSYQIVIEDTDDGDVVASSKSAKRNATVTLTVTADKGYELDELTVTDSKGKEITVKEKSNGKYTFTMPSSKVTVDATFVAEDQDDTANTDFVDVDDKAYYADAVKWAVEKDVTTGTGKNTFGPGEITTRAQTVTFLWRAMGSPEPKTTVCPFEDVAKSAYYYDAVLWAVEKGITEGTSATEFSPNETVTRAQTVTFLWRMAGKPEVTAAGAFADVAADAYYYQAVEWAVAEEITSGTSATTFSPAAACARAQIVTFLYNYLGK